MVLIVAVGAAGIAIAILARRRELPDRAGTSQFLELSMARGQGLA